MAHPSKHSLVPLGASDLYVFPLCLGGNVFGWTADQAQSFAVLDAFAAGGGNFIDTADMYSVWAPGNRGGESESVLGRWMKARGNRDRIVIATKVGKLALFDNLRAATIRAAAEASLKRLQTDHIDLYYAHFDDRSVLLEETLGAFDALVRAGQVRWLGASNYTAPRLAEALAVSKAHGFARYVALQPHYSLLHRHEYEGDLATLCVREQIGCVPFYALARGFLAGRDRVGYAFSGPRSVLTAVVPDDRSLRVLALLDEIAAARRTSTAAVALAWLRVQPGVVAPIAGARLPEQVLELLPGATLELGPEELTRLAVVSEPGP